LQACVHYQSPNEFKSLARAVQILANISHFQKEKAPERGALGRRGDRRSLERRIESRQTRRQSRSGIRR
jgi:hypothetical protein